MTPEEATEQLFTLLYNYSSWNHELDEPNPHEEILAQIRQCVQWGADRTHIHSSLQTPPLLLAIKHYHHPTIIQYLAEAGTMLDFKRKTCDYILDTYIGEEYVVRRYDSIMNHLLSMYLSSVGKCMDSILVEKYTERQHSIETYQYPLDRTDYFYCVDSEEEDAYTGPFCWEEVDSNIQHDCVEQREPSYNFYYSSFVPLKKDEDTYSKRVMYVKYLFNEYCNLLKIEPFIFNTLEEELPDDYRYKHEY